MRFTFLDPGPLVDQELRLVAPGVRWVEELLLSIGHPRTSREDHRAGEQPLTRQKIHDFLRAAPGGWQAGDPSSGRVPSYHFWMVTDPPVGDPPIRIVGGIGLRIGAGTEIELYSGNIGYHVYPPARGRHFAERACRLLFPLARRHGMERLWITCNPDNLASRRTCERLGGTLVDVVTIPKEHPFRTRGETAKCRYLIQLV
jgi:tagatose 1,6-diphosphate aldolase